MFWIFQLGIHVSMGERLVRDTRRLLQSPNIWGWRQKDETERFGKSLLSETLRRTLQSITRSRILNWITAFVSLLSSSLSSRLKERYEVLKWHRFTPLVCPEHLCRSTTSEVDDRVKKPFFWIWMDYWTRIGQNE